MNKTKTNIKHNADGTWYFQSTVTCSYDAKVKVKSISPVFAKCSGDVLLQCIDAEERRLGGIIMELDKEFVQKNMDFRISDVQSMQSYIKQNIVHQRLTVKYNRTTFKVHDIESARVCLSALNVVFQHPTTLPAVAAIVPHLLRQRMFEILQKGNVLSPHRIFDNAFVGNSCTVI